MKNIFCLILLALFARLTLSAQGADSSGNAYNLDTLTYFDTLRQRPIPVAIYTPSQGQAQRNRLIIFNHGYGYNQGGDYLAYSYLTGYLASRGFVVVSIQHELPTDSLMPTEGIPQVVRYPFWERGVDNIHFVIQELKQKYPDFNNYKPCLMGHSNGGDMCALFAKLYPNEVNVLITLDNRRMPLPRSKDITVFSLRSSDQVADSGVVPTELECRGYPIIIQKLVGVTHNDMSNPPNEGKRAQVQDWICQFLRCDENTNPKPGVRKVVVPVRMME